MASYSYTPMAGNGSLTTNGQLVPVPMSGAFFPSSASAPFYKGNGQPPPTIPVNFASTGNVAMGGGSMDATTAATAGSNPFNFAQSPLIMSVAALAIGLIGLRYVHWRG